MSKDQGGAPSSLLLVSSVSNEVGGAPTACCILLRAHPEYNHNSGAPKSLWDTNHDHFPNLLPWMSDNCGRTSILLLMLPLLELE